MSLRFHNKFTKYQFITMKKSVFYMAVAAIIFMFARCNQEEVNSPVFPHALCVV